MRLQFEIWDIIVGLVVEKFACFQDKGLDGSVLHMYKWAIIKEDVMSIKENSLIFDRVGAEYVVELGRVYKPHFYIHIPRLCVMDFTV